MVKAVGYLRPFVDGSHYFRGVGDHPRTLRDLAMGRLSAELRDIPEWWTLYRSSSVRERWMRDALTKTWPVGPPANNIEIGLTEKQIEYVLDELSGYDSLRNPNTGVQVSCFERIWHSDCLITMGTQTQLMDAIDAFRSSRPRAANGSLLIDPCRYPLVHNRAYSNITISLEDPDDYSVSTKFAALPTDVQILPSAQAVQFLSYINSIDPEDRKFYVALESTLGPTINLFEKVMTDLHRNNPLPRRIVGHCHYTEWDEPEDPEDSEDEDAWEEHIEEYILWELNRPLEIPDVPSTGFRADSFNKKHTVELGGTSVQVVVQVSDVHLNPLDGDMPATDWHVEGMANERFIACAQYVCHMDNVKDVYLEFRMATTWPTGFLPGDIGATLRTWGFRDGDACNQCVGTTQLRPGLAIAYPNIYQSRQSSISLQDPNKPGRLTIVSFFLVDPDAPPIPSTSSVSPQQLDWVYRAVEASLDRRLPLEVVEKIMSYVDSVMTEDEAEDYAMEMHREREAFRVENDAKYFCLPFDARMGV